MIRIVTILLLLVLSFSARAQEALVVQNCGTLPQVYSAGSTRQATVDVNGTLCSLGNIQPFVKYQPTLWYRYLGWQGSQAGTAASVDVIECTVVGVAQKVTTSNIGARITTTLAGGFFQMALYSDINGRPGTLLGNTASLTTAANDVTAPMVLQLGPGGSAAPNAQTIWTCQNLFNPTVVFSTPLAAASWGPQAIGSTTESMTTTAAMVSGLTCSGANCAGGSSTFGTWPASLVGTTWTFTNTTTPLLPVFQVGSVP